MVDSEYSTNISTSLTNSIGTVMRHPKTVKFVPDHPKTKTIVSMQ